MQRVIPGMPGTRLQLDAQGGACLIPFDQWMTQAPPLAPGRLMRLLQRNAVIQHGRRLRRLLHSTALQQGDLFAFLDALLAFPQIPQLITCHDLTPLVIPTAARP